MRVGRRKVRKKGTPNMTDKFAAEKENCQGGEISENLEVQMDN
jgi:hypothetical protein